MKKYAVWALVLCLIIQLALPMAAAGAAAQFNIASLVAVARYMTGQGSLTPEQLSAYDLDGNGQIGIVDLTKMALIVIGSSIPTPPADEVGDQRAMELALAEVPGAQQSNITEFKREPEHGNIVYDITIVYGGFEYEFEINAKDGSFLSWSQDKMMLTAGSGDIGLDAARGIALERITGASYQDVRSFKADYEDGVKVYEGEIVYGGRRYECEIQASSGEVVKWSWELTNAAVPVPTTMPAPTSAPTASSLPTTSSVPTAAPAGFSEQQARELVLARVPGATNANFTEFKLDYENGQRVYKGELVYGGVEYDFEVSAVDGDLLKWGWETRPQAGSAGVDIGMANARALMVEEVPGAVDSDLIKCVRDHEDGIAVYEGELHYGGRKYEFEVVAATGVFCKWSYEPASTTPIRPNATARPTTTTTIAPAPNPDWTPVPTSASGQISADRAKEIALSQVPGAALSNVTKCELDREDGRLVYEVEIWYGNVEYEFEILASNGQIIHSSQDHHAKPTAKPTVQQPAASGDIGREAAMQLVLNRVPGATAANFKEFELDREDGILVYEGELKYRGVEYEFEIVASSGKFLKWEVDYDD